MSVYRAIPLCAASGFRKASENVQRANCGCRAAAPNNQKAYVCICVFRNEKPVKLVSRGEGSWSILCGDSHPQDASSYRVVGIGHEFEKDPTLLELIDLAPDWEAERTKVGKPWTRIPVISES